MKPATTLLFAALLSFTGCAHNPHLNAGDDYYEAGDYQQAVSKYEDAVQHDPGSEEARKKLEVTRRKHLEEQRARADRAISEKRFGDAIRTAERAFELLPEAQTTFEIIDAVVVALRPHARMLTNQGRFEEAAFLWAEVRDRLPPLRSESTRAHDQIQKTLLDGLVSRAVESEEAGRIGDAYLYWTKAASISKSPFHTGQQTRLRQEVLEQSAYLVFVEPSERTLITEVARQLMSESRGTMRFTDEREKAHAILTIRTTNPEFSTFEGDQKGTKEYQSGVRKVENPRWVEVSVEVEEADRKLTEAEQALAARDAEVLEDQAKVTSPTANITSLALEVAASARKREAEAKRVQTQRARVTRLREKLAQISPTVDEPIFSTFAYTVKRVVRKAEIDMTIEIRHSDQRPELKFEASVIARESDEGHEAHEKYAIPANRLQIPQDKLVLAKLEDNAAGKAFAKALTSFADWRSTMLSKADQAEDESTRMDMYARYLSSAPDQAKPHVLHAIQKFRGIENPQILFE